MSDEVEAKAAPAEDFLGIPVTAEGKARWRARLNQLDAKWTPEKWAELRRQYGISS
jgi:hypothetical protein